MRAEKPLAATVETWLKANLGKDCLATCCGQDHKALSAAVQTAALWGNSDKRPQAAAAFAMIVLQMQPEARELAFHATAHALDWGHRYELWIEAGLPPLDRIRVCAHGPKPTGKEVEEAYEQICFRQEMRDRFTSPAIPPERLRNHVIVRDLT